ncbi:restriction endonuclease subunit S [Dictyobacter aurantiacus]|uniref:Type I restriction modification DNA specificity domain-containing protein n=1 Tax=Dictyobacter aurantiacus TaxID=1936993 RepID=A0A401ZD23_9CHLR|nr:restriction endonuclease subunit S [Dictyobacter aurantiacus]GCE04791.1 hypothetical protein KDAU_21200 [Dictyobacter aurantiacus]
MKSKTTLGEFVLVNPSVKLIKGNEYPFVEMGNIIPGNRYVNSLNSRIFNGGGARFCSGDTLFARITPCLENGKIAFFKSKDKGVGFGSTEFIILRHREGISDPDYIFYLATSDIVRKPAEKSMSGSSGRQRADINSIKEVEIFAPNLIVQRKIASILSAYDDLIENNTRRIAILEEIAQSLYQEWFVHYRFPGHEKIKMIESELGLIPEGWKVVNFTDMADILSGGTPKTTIPEYWNGDIPFFTPKDASPSLFVLTTEKNITSLGLNACSSKLYPKNTIFITARGTVGKVFLNAVDMAMNQSCYALQGKGGFPQYFLFMHIRNCIDQLRQNAHGAVFDTIIVDTFKRLRVVSPFDETINTFVSILSPVFEQMLNLLKKNENLRHTRDLLLPKLISGDMDVEHLFNFDKFKENIDELIPVIKR